MTESTLFTAAFVLYVASLARLLRRPSSPGRRRGPRTGLVLAAAGFVLPHRRP
ncbi:MAG: hypothetical protein M0C28_20820 [Candidatus Moduliflexus flocculans]|nr:hypothetical protein [Candidatus Moduliflexus flocculans]